MTAACAICSSPELRQLGPYGHCRSCDYWSSDLEVDVENTSAPDSEYELVAYEHTRAENYTTILAMLESRHPPGSRLLELGCADGLFLKMARDRNGYVGIGIEPNAKMMSGNRHGVDIRPGFFPSALTGADQTFDVIALNCVFEHVPDLDPMIESFKRYLAPGGSVMINVPVSTGLMFKLSRRLYDLRVRYPFDRIWQKGFVSPHVHYFSRANLGKLFSRHRMSLVAEQKLTMFSLGGIYQRLSLDPNIRFAQRMSALGFLYLYYPVSRLLPDARAFVFALD